MKTLLKIATAFIAGAFGGAANGVVLWLSGLLGITVALGFKMAPGMNWAFMWPRLFYGGLWGFLFLLPFWRERTYLKGLVISLAPSAYMLFKVFPEMGAGVLGLGRGPGAPYFVLFFNAVWGLAAAWLIMRSSKIMTGDARG